MKIKVGTGGGGEIPPIIIEKPEFKFNKKDIIISPDKNIYIIFDCVPALSSYYRVIEIGDNHKYHKLNQFVVDNYFILSTSFILKNL